MLPTETQTDYDVIIIGAGISGFCFAYRLQERHPHLTYCILEQRDAVGGTWDLFKYPGLRSDSDLFTFGFPWLPWTENEPIAQGPSILNYMHRAAADTNIAPKIKFNRKVHTLSWSTKQRAWTVSTTAHRTTPETLRSTFIMLATGYYDYDTPLAAHIPGIETFGGPVIHPQFWPPDLDYTNKSVVVIGSGATAITLLPALAPQAAHVTMLQRSPSYILPLPRHDRIDHATRAIFPARLAAALIRLKWIVLPTLFRAVCIAFPGAARRMMRRITRDQLPADANLEPDFSPAYNPFEQRMCMCPDGDFYECLRSGRGSVKTGTIEAVTHDAIRLRSGEELRPDVIVTATGLRLRLGGGIGIEVDGVPFRIPEHYVWRGMMVEDLPNVAFSFGYVDASWTLGVDMSARMACRVLGEMEREGARACVPRRSEEERREMKEGQFFPLQSTYVVKAREELPKVGDRAQWRARSSYLWEVVRERWCDVRSGIEWIR